mmetsp:Transcript_78523/g.153609  ORF Transcript_78523/g.153609 Transcript_78523/m.153609 type:complete len:630 (+) Transcript_78523:48-1937(+)
MTTLFSNTFEGPKLTIADFLKAKEGLRQTPATVVTQADGRRFIESSNGLRTEMAAQSADQDGKWGVMDENAALGLTPDDCTAPATITESMPNLSASFEVVKISPCLARYVQLLQVGVPLEAVKSQAVAAESTGKLPQGSVSRLLAAAAAQDGSPGPGVHSPSEHLEGSHSEKHGWLGDAAWEAPRVAVRCDVEARAGYNSAKGHEYLDSPEVLRAKVKVLAAMFRKAKHPVVYAGAGLSTASGIGDYATQTGKSGVLAKSRQDGAAATGGPGVGEKGILKKKVGEGLLASTLGMKDVSPMCARPNRGHRALAAMAKQGHVWRFVQQNHDGLPQKAGMPQHLINEIHGAWFDPSNPVVAMSGGLRSDLFEDLLLCERKADLVLAVGSSLCGMNADRLVSSAAVRARKERNDIHALSDLTSSKAKTENSVGASAAAAAAAVVEKGPSSLPPLPRVAFGSVIVSLQQTVHDHNSSLRIFALIDDVLGMLAEELVLHSNSKNSEAPETTVPATALGASDSDAAKVGESDVFLVPYDANTGMRLQGKSATHLLRLDLTEGSLLTISAGPDTGRNAVVIGKNKDGHWRVSIERQFKGGGRMFHETRLLGSWWPREATAGQLPYIPVVPRACSSMA